MKSTVFGSVILLALGLQRGMSQTPTTLDADYLESLRSKVRAEHPSVAAAQARIRAADAGIRGVRLWEDPMAGLSVMAAEANMRRDDGDLMFSFEQVLPRRKLHEAQKSRAKAERSMFAAELRATTVKLEALVVQTAIEVALADEIIAITTNQIRWLESMALNARERIKDPNGNVSEALRIESELAQEKQKLDSNVLLRRRLTRQLNILLGQAADERWDTIKLPDSSSATPALEVELARLSQVNPMLQSLFSTAQAARADIEIAKRQSQPLFSVGVDSRIYSGGDFREASVGAKMTIPLFNKSIYKANIERAKNQQEAAEREVESLERELRSQLVTAYTDAENAARQATTFSKEVIPRTEQAVQSTQNAWISSKASLLEVLVARRDALNARLEERRFIAAQRAAIESLRSIVPPQSQP